MDGEWLVGWLIMSDCVEKKNPHFMMCQSKNLQENIKGSEICKGIYIKEESKEEENLISMDIFYSVSF